MTTITVIGGGAWGTALALTAARAGNRVTLVARDASTVAAITERMENPDHLPGVRIDGITATTDVGATALYLACTNHSAPMVARLLEVGAAAGAGRVVLAVPAQAVRTVASAIAPRLARGTPVIIAAKGLEQGSGKRLSEVLAESAPSAIPA